MPVLSVISKMINCVITCISNILSPDEYQFFRLSYWKMKRRQSFSDLFICTPSALFMSLDNVLCMASPQWSRGWSYSMWLHHPAQSNTWPAVNHPQSLVVINLPVLSNSYINAMYQVQTPSKYIKWKLGVLNNDYILHLNLTVDSVRIL